MPRLSPSIITAAAILGLFAGCKSPAPVSPPAPAAPPAPIKPPEPPPAVWETENPVVPLPRPPLGVQADFGKLKVAVTPEKVRLGRWLFFDKRISVDGSVSCATCHRPESAFSEPTPHSTGVAGKVGGRKSPTFINGAWPLFDVYFWDGRATSLSEQAKGPMANPIEMGGTHEGVAKAIAGVPGYRRIFRAVYGDDRVDIDRIADAIAAYEATRMSGNSRFDRFDAGDAAALDEKEKLGRDLFHGKAECNQCHLGWNLTDSQFHNLGIGWAGKPGKPGKAGKANKEGFADPGRAKVSNKDEDTGAFKTPTLREVTKHAPYMHDGSLATLRDVVQHYNKGGNPNPWLSPKIKKLKLSPAEIDALVAFMTALDGEGYQDTPPKSFP